MNKNLSSSSSSSSSYSDRALELMKPAPPSPKTSKSPDRLLSDSEKNAFLNKLRSTDTSTSLLQQKKEAIQIFFDLIKRKGEKISFGRHLVSFIDSPEGQLLDEETRARIVDENGATALEHILCWDNHCTAFNAIVLLKKGFNTKPSSETGNTFLMTGIEYRNYEFCSAILSQKLGPFQEYCDGKYVNFQGENALHIAIHIGDFEFVKLLVKNKYSAPPPTRCVPGIIHFIIHHCRDMSNAQMMGEYLVKNGYGINDVFFKQQMTTYQSALLHNMLRLAAMIYDHKDYVHGRVCHLFELKPMTDEEFEETLKTQRAMLLRKCPDGPAGFASAYPRQTKPLE